MKHTSTPVPQNAGQQHCQSGLDRESSQIDSCLRRNDNNANTPTLQHTNTPTLQHANTPTPQNLFLANGLKLIHVYDGSNPVLCLQLYIKAGSVKEQAKHRGYSHFIEHLCFKSTRDFPNNQLSRYASSLGGMLNAFTDYDCTCYYLLVPSEQLSAGLHILSQLARESNFSAQDVKIEKDIILEEIKQYENDPEPDFIEFVQSSYFKNSPLKHPVLGTVKTVSEARFRSLRDFYARHYSPDNAFLVVCGDYQAAELVSAVERYFGSWKSKRSPIPYPNGLEPEMNRFKAVFRKRNRGEEFLAVVMPELSEIHPQSDALLVAIRYLAIGKSSRLFKRLVEEEKLCSAVKVSSLSGVLSGASVILFCPIGRKSVARILQIFKQEFHALLGGGIPPDELELVKRDIIHSWIYSFEGMENLANLVAAEEFIGNLDLLHSYGDKISALSMHDVEIAMRAYWPATALSIYHEGASSVVAFAKFKLEDGEMARWSDGEVEFDEMVLDEVILDEVELDEVESCQPIPSMNFSTNIAADRTTQCPCLSEQQHCHSGLDPESIQIDSCLRRNDNNSTTPPPQHPLTPAPQYTSTPPPQHPSTPAPQHPNTSIRQIDPLHYQIFLSNGMQVQFRQLDSKTVSGFSLSTPISQLCESPQQRGFNFFCSTLLLYGSQKRSHEELMRFSRANGFNIRVIHHLDSTSFRGKCRSANLEIALSMLSELITVPRFERDHLRLLTSSALDGIRRDNDYPVSYAYQKWFKMMVGEDSNLFRSTGNPADIRAIRLSGLQNWFDGWNLGSHFAMAIVGAHQPAEIADICENLFGRVSNPAAAEFRQVPLFTKLYPHERIQKRETDQAIIHLGGWACPAANRTENAAFHVLSHILGGDISSRFFDVLREKHGFAYQTGFDFSSISELGFWNAYAFCAKKDYKKCVAVMKDILAELVSDGISEPELESAKQYLIGMNRFDYESVSYSASSMSNLAALGYEPEFYLSREQRLKEVSCQTIKQIARQWLLPENHYMHILV